MENQNQMTFPTYRALDVTVFTLIACTVEFFNMFVFRRFFSTELYTLSLAVPLTLIVMMRWNWWGIVTAALTGLAFCKGANASELGTYLAYMLGNCFVLINLVWFKVVGKEKIAKSVPIRIAFAVTGFLLAVLGRTIVALPFEGNFVGNFVRFFVSDEISGLIGIFVLIIASKQKDLFKDQKTWLRELTEEREKNSRKKEEQKNE